MKKLLLLLLFVLIVSFGFGQRYTIELSPNTGYFMLDSVDYVQGHYELRYEGRIDVDTLRRFSLYNIYTDKYLINSHYFTAVYGVNSWDELSQLLEETGVVSRPATNKSFNQQIAEDLLVGYDSEFKFGQNVAVGSVEEVIWDGGGNYIFLEAAEVLKIVSDDANDSVGGTGANTLIVYGLNANWDETFQIISLDGLDTVLTDTAFLRVFRAHVITSGNPNPIGDSNLGKVNILGASTLTVQAQILEGNGQTLMCVYTIPRGKTGYVTGISFAVGEGKDCTFKGKFRNGINGAFSVKYSITLFESSFFGTLQVPLRIPEKIDIVLTAISTAVSVQADASFGIILKDN